MMKRSRVCLFLLICVATSAGNAADDSNSRAYLSAGWRFAEQGGEALYTHICAACHQADGEGAVGAAAYPALANNPNLASKDYVESVLLRGLRSMPALGRTMSDEQVADVVNYVRHRFGPRGDDPVSAAESKAARPQ
jgi:mono/diheme cytochrome c family protein